MKCKRCNAKLRSGNAIQFCSPCQAKLSAEALKNDVRIMDPQDLFEMEQNNWKRMRRNYWGFG